ncbi:MAG TPA: hypothetical protein DEP84_02130 [Chloroflexi bacterium]|nr:hypothetical protein [Chloroflexota bacterium]
MGDRPGKRVTRYDLAMIYRQQGRLREAVEALKRVVGLDALVQDPDLEQDQAMLAQVGAEWRAGAGGRRTVKADCSLLAGAKRDTTDRALSIATHPTRRPPAHPPLAAGSRIAAGAAICLDCVGDRRCNLRRGSRGGRCVEAWGERGSCGGRGGMRGVAGAGQDSGAHMGDAHATDPLAAGAVGSALPCPGWAAVRLVAV